MTSSMMPAVMELPSSTPNPATPAPALKGNSRTRGATLLPPLVLDRQSAADLLCIGVRKLDELLADPTLAFPRIRLGDRVLIPAEALRHWIAQKAKHDTPAPRDLSKIALTPSRKNRRPPSAPGSASDTQ